jgi:hypothetical protein
LSFLLLITASTAAAQTSIRDLVSLRAAGLSDDILIALIESDDSVFRLTADQVIDLRRQGLSERVILAMLATPRKLVQPPVAPHERPDPAVFAPERTRHERLPEPDPEPLPPVTIHVTQIVEQRVEAPEERRTRYVQVPVVVPVPVRQLRTSDEPKPAPAPTYWGWGGRQAPGTWQPSSSQGRGGPPSKPVPDKKPGG